jgi:hypothetical protein
MAHCPLKLMTHNLVILLTFFTTFINLKFSFLTLIIIRLGYFYFGSSHIIKKLLILEIVSIIVILLLSTLINNQLISLDLLLTLLVFFVIDAVLGLSLLISLSRKRASHLKIRNLYWLCS